MRVRTFCVAIAFLILAAQVSGEVHAANLVVHRRSSSVAPSFLQTQGTLIVNEQGTTVNLCGAAFMGYEFGAFDSHTYADYQKIASLGYNVVRLPIAWSFVEPEQGRYDSRYLKNIDRDIAWAKSLNLYVVLDMHQYYWSPTFRTDGNGFGNGMPTWMTSKYDSGKEGRLSSITDFWASDSLRGKFKQMWQFVASRYANEPAIAGYDLLNEPPAGSTSIDTFLGTTLPRFYEETASAIRQVDSRHMLFFEPPLEAQHMQVKISANNVVFAPHFYYLAFEGSYNGAISTLEWHLNSQTQGLQVPVWIGEFGIETKTQGYQSWIADSLGLFSKYHVAGWSWWTYWKDDSISMCLAHSDGSLRTELTTLLAPTS
jgi:endoglycosylceramidase